MAADTACPAPAPGGRKVTRAASSAPPSAARSKPARDCAGDQGSGAAPQPAVAATQPGARFTDPHDATVQVLAQGLLDLGLLNKTKHGTAQDVIEKRAYFPFYMHRTSPDLPPQVGVLVQLAKDAAEAGKDIAQHIAAFAPQFVRREDIPAESIATERRIAEETARAEGKPEASISKIVEGRITGFVKEVSLLEQAFAKDAKKTVQQIADEAKTAVSAFHRFRVGQ